MPEESDQKPAEQPQRLQSLSARGGRGGMRGGRFLPNAVSRRSKEERESSAPALKPQSPSPDTGKQQPKKFERRKQRQLGTRAEAAGPLAAPTIASTSAARPVRAVGAATPAGSTGGSGVRIKTEDSAISAALASDVRIDMSAAVEDRDSFIPLRMPKDTASVPGAVAAEAQSGDAGENGATNLSDDAATARLDAEQKSGAEDEEGKHRGAVPDSSSESSESTDGRLRLEENGLYFFHLPDLGLTVGEAPADSPLHQSELGAVKVKAEEPSTGAAAPLPPAPANEDGDIVMGEPDSAPPVVGAAGRLGTLRTHASGKMTMLIGDAVYEVFPGTHSASAEELVVLNETARVARPLGSVRGRVLVIPDLDTLHI